LFLKIFSFKCLKLESYVKILELDCNRKKLTEQSFVQIKKPEGGVYRVNIPKEKGDKLLVVQTFDLSEIKGVSPQER
jgi:hypothetical protein